MLAAGLVGDVSGGKRGKAAEAQPYRGFASSLSFDIYILSGQIQDDAFSLVVSSWYSSWAAYILDLCTISSFGIFLLFRPRIIPYSLESHLHISRYIKMHGTSSLLFLCFLFVSFLSIAQAYPRPQSLAVRVVPNPAATQHINHQTNANASSRKNQQKKDKDKERESLDKNEQQDFESEPPETADDESDIDSVEDGGSGKCFSPLTPQFADRFKDGHGCKKIAEAFKTCGSSSESFCSSKRKKCLCDQKEDFNDELVERCYKSLVDPYQHAAQGLAWYYGFCGS